MMLSTPDSYPALELSLTVFQVDRHTILFMLIQLAFFMVNVRKFVVGIIIICQFVYVCYPTNIFLFDDNILVYLKF